MSGFAVGFICGLAVVFGITTIGMTIVLVTAIKHAAKDGGTK